MMSFFDAERTDAKKLLNWLIVAALLYFIPSRSRYGSLTTRIT